MFYLVQPDGTVLWNDLPTRLVKDLIAEQQLDLARLDWKPAELPFTLDLVRLALRHGVPSSIGIGLEGIIVATVNRATEIRKLQREGAELRAKNKATMEAIDDFIESNNPGWKSAGDRINKAADESVEASAVEADEEASKLYAAEPKDYLVTFWQDTLGGIVPPEDDRRRTPPPPVPGLVPRDPDDPNPLTMPF